MSATTSGCTPAPIARHSALHVGWSVFLAILTVLAALLASSEPASARVVDRILATIDGKPVTVFDLKTFAARRRLVSGRAEPPPEELLEEFLTEHLMAFEIEAQGLQARQEDVDRYVQDVLRRNRISEEQLRQVLESQGVPWETYREQVAREIEKAQLINRELRAKVNVTPEEVEKEYRSRRDQWATPRRYEISQIFLRVPQDPSPDALEQTMRRAEELARRARSGANFSELAREHSQGPAAKDGGKLGTFTLDEMLPEVAEAVRGLKPGQVSVPVRSQTGIHVVRVDRIIESGYEPLEKHAEEIREELYQKRIAERYERWLKEDLPSRHHIVRKEPPAAEELAPLDFERIAAEGAAAATSS